MADECLSLEGLDDPAADDLIATVKDRGLTRTQRTLRNMEMDAQGFCAERLNSSRCGRRGVANLHVDIVQGGKEATVEEVKICHIAAGAKE